jgi:hypothetical protein
MGSKNSLLNELIHDVDEQMSSTLSRTELDRLARITGFTKRCGRAKITGSMFLDLLVFNANKLSDLTLEDCCEELMIRHSRRAKRQSLQERFNLNAVVFLKAVLEILLRRKFPMPPIFIKYDMYKRVLVKDSTCFQLPEKLRKQYPGSGGKDTGAAARIQFEYDILSGSIVDLNITAFNRQDATDSTETLNLIREGDLVIRDIAYMHKHALIKMTEQRASYVSRLDSRISVHEVKNGCYERLDFKRLYMEMRRKRISIMEKMVYLGADHLHRTRLIVYMIPEQIREQRLRKIRHERKRNGSGEPTKELKDRSRLILIITNDLNIPAEHLYTLYMIRWQIELVFKTWKSICGIASIKQVNKHRVECYIIGKLIFILIGWNIIRPLMNHVFTNSRVTVSYYKAMKSLVHRTKELSSILIFGLAEFRKFIKNYLQNMMTNCLSDLKKGKEAYLDIIAFKIQPKAIKTSALERLA